MARDPQAALMALNRFGLGARGGASGDLIKAASDPRGFVKADLNRQGSPRLEMPGLQPTPALAQAVFAYQAEAKAAREAAKGKSSAEMAGSEKPTTVAGDTASESKPLDNRSTDSRVMEKSAVDAAPRANEAAPSGKPLNVIPKDFSRRGPGAIAAGADGRRRVRRAARDVLVQSFLHLGCQR